ncbi:MAG: Uma2 family endonuclease [Anaerolineae bacterium]|nr:Uma2 family endonuclease [Anaerolineae bacterium]
MATLIVPAPTTLPSDKIVATGVSADEYMAHYAETFHEWVEGAVIKMSPASLRHTLLTQYLIQWLNAYFALRPVGQVFNAPFVMRLDEVKRAREPDLQIVLKDNPGELTDTAMIGPADICIEVVSPESVARDYGVKFNEYEKAGVREYWIIDPLRQRCDFNRRGDSGMYTQMKPDDTGEYHTPLLPHLTLHVPTLWQETLPDVIAIVQAVQAMVAAE